MTPDEFALQWPPTPDSLIAWLTNRGRANWVEIKMVGAVKRWGETPIWQAASILLALYFFIYFFRSLLLLLTGKFDIVVQLELVSMTPSLTTRVIFLLLGAPLVIGLVFYISSRMWSDSGRNKTYLEFSLSPWLSTLVVLLSMLLSLLMFRLGVGVTTAPIADPLPFRLAGLLYYTRLLLVPLILAVTASKAQGRFRSILTLLLFLNVMVAAVSSGSRLVVALQSLALLWVTSRLWIRLALVAGALLLGINIASRARDLWLAPVANAPDLFGKDQTTGSHTPGLYGNEVAAAAAADWSTFFGLILDYAMYRALGLPELIMSASTDRLCSSNGIWQTILSTLSGKHPCYEIREILRIPETSPGGFSVDPIGTLWLSSGGDSLAFIVLSAIVGLALGFTFAASLDLEYRLGTRGLALLCLTISLILFFESRYQVLISFTMGLAVVGAALRFMPGDDKTKYSA